ncbi:hypothetical protein BDZ97DRAFT_1211293 [Flammula alnicola]|nr:hypothetical protein BDZ97DRAFT_1211293 [Flammula alnicola]
MDRRPPPPQGAPPSYAFVSRVYRRNLRPVVLAFAFLGGLWALFSGIGFFRNASVYSRNDETKLTTFSIIIGALYMGVLAIECLGVFAAASQKLPIVRLYAYLSAVVFLIIAAVGLIRTIIHFSLKNDIINTCTNVSSGETFFFPGLFGPVNGGTLTTEEAASWCRDAWDRDSWSEVVAFLLTSLLAAFFSAIAFSYLRQVLDPASPANASREPAQHRMGAFPSHYNPPYNPNGPAPYYSYPAPAGPPPSNAFVAPPYEADGKPPGTSVETTIRAGMTTSRRRMAGVATVI